MAVLLMRSSYAVADELDFIAMDEFQKVTVGVSVCWLYGFVVADAAGNGMGCLPSSSTMGAEWMDGLGVLFLSTLRLESVLIKFNESCTNTQSFFFVRQAEWEGK